MGSKKDAVEEIKRRIKRLDAEIEIIEGRLQKLEESRVKYNFKTTKKSSYTAYYLILMGLWMVIGALVLGNVSKRLPFKVGLPILPLLLTGFVIIGASFIYLLRGEREESESPFADLEEKERMLKILLSQFYTPLLKAIEEEDSAALRSLADRVMNDPTLSKALKRTGEGDPREVAYALYLYAVYGEELKPEVEEALKLVQNRALRALLSTLIESQS